MTTGKTSTRGPATGGPAIRIPELPPQKSIDEDQQHQWWLGTLPGCPVQNIDAAGVSFPLFTGSINFDEKGQAVDGNGNAMSLEHHFGCEIRHSKERVQKAVDDLAHKVIRKTPTGGEIVDMRDKRYIPQRGDRRALSWVYCVPGHRKPRLPAAIVTEET